jgi:uncharacterized protein
VVPVGYPGVYIEELPLGVKSIEGVATSTTAFVGAARSGPIDNAVVVRSLVEFDRAFGPVEESDPMRIAVQLFFANGGADAVVVRAGGPVMPAAPAIGGLRALDDIGHVDLLCLPTLWADGPAHASAFVDVASRYCAGRGAILLVDPSPEWRSASDVVTGLASIESLVASAERGFAAAFFPNLLVATVSGDVACGPTGAIAGLLARTDRARGVWRAPAGLEATIAGTRGPAVTVGESRAAKLARAGVNTIRQFPGAGTVLWGARLLSGAAGGDAEWQYVNIRRLFIFLEHSIDEGTRWAVFEPNEEPLWASLRQAIGSFLFSLFRQGAFAGVTPDEAFFVKCGLDTMTQADVDAGRLNVLVGFAPLRPSEFVILRIGHHRP